MHGNVWEWCSDRWHVNYNGAPTDGSSWETGTYNKRVQRGGSWVINAVYCRSADRVSYSADGWWKVQGFSRSGNVGFFPILVFREDSSLVSIDRL